MKKSVFLLPLLLFVTAECLAERPQMGNRNVSKTVTTDRGTRTQTVDRVKTENGFIRDMSVTRPDGATATRHTEVERDRESKTATRDYSGTRFDGSSYSGSRVTQRTETGKIVNSQHTNAQGQTVYREAETIVDRDAQTLTKNIAVTDAQGEVHNKTIVKTKN